jgi:hypothetical protein
MAPFRLHFFVPFVPSWFLDLFFLLLETHSDETVLHPTSAGWAYGLRGCGVARYCVPYRDRVGACSPKLCP